MNPWDAAGWAITAFFGIGALCVLALPVASIVGRVQSRRRERLLAAEKPAAPPLEEDEVRLWGRQIMGADSCAIWDDLERGGRP